MFSQSCSSPQIDSSSPLSPASLWRGGQKTEHPNFQGEIVILLPSLALKLTQRKTAKISFSHPKSSKVPMFMPMREVQPQFLVPRWKYWCSVPPWKFRCLGFWTRVHFHKSLPPFNIEPCPLPPFASSFGGHKYWWSAHWRFLRRDWHWTIFHIGNKNLCPLSTAQVARSFAGSDIQGVFLTGPPHKSSKHKKLI